MATPLAPPVRAANRTNLLVLLFAGFILTGVPTVIVGPILPLFISRWSLDDAQAGLFFSVQFAASLCGVWMTTALTSRWGYRPALCFGYLLTGAGLALLNAPRHVVALIATASFGLGYGMVVPPTNLSAAEAGGERSAGLVNLLNFAWGIGAVACSPLIMLAVRHHFLTTFLLVLALGAFVLAGCFLFATFPADKHAAPLQSSPTRASVPALDITVGIAVLFFVYVGIETSVGGWAAEHAKRLTSHGGSLATVAPMFFYAGLMIGRAVVPLILMRVRESWVAFSAVILAATGVSVVIVATTQPVAIVGLATAGLGCASIYPIYVAWFSMWYGAAARRLSGVVFSMASFGGSAMPLLVGFVSTQAGSLRIGLLVPLAGCFLTMGVLALLRRQILL